MPDRLTPEQRKRCMTAVKSRDTKPEMLVRRHLFAKGLRFRVGVRSLPGTPDIVLPRYKTVIFVNGCFWHGHKGCKLFKLPATNTQFWREKIERNMQRDQNTDIELSTMGWRVIRVWECDLSPAKRAATLEALYHTVVGRPLTYYLTEIGFNEIMAAEDASDYLTRQQ